MFLGQTALDISKDGSTLTNDQVQCNAAITYGGSLTVTKLGPTALNDGDRFQLFTAPGYSGSFSALTLPPLAPGLAWTNRLTLDGSIEVIGQSLAFTSVTLSGSDLIMSGTGGPTNGNYFVLASTNIALPLTGWTRLMTNQFNSAGNFTFSNTISPSIPHRFYLLQLP